jgi:hypothetical protein
MVPVIDWGNMALAFAAMAGFLGWMVYFGLSMTGPIPDIPRHAAKSK